MCVYVYIFPNVIGLFSSNQLERLQLLKRDAHTRDINMLMLKIKAFLALRPLYLHMRIQGAGKATRIAKLNSTPLEKET